MKILPALFSQCETVYALVQRTIGEVYPHYYPRGAVDFFLAHHSMEHIRQDILAHRVYLLTTGDQAVGTVTVYADEINRLFVLPEQQGKGYGKALLQFAEQVVFERYEQVQLSTSLPGRGLYRKAGYCETAYHTEAIGEDFLCWDTMIKARSERCRLQNEEWR